MQTAPKYTHDRVYDAAILDTHFYAPLAKVIQEPYPLSFGRMTGGPRTRNIDVVLQEGPYTSYIAEYPSYAKDCRFFSLELSFVNGGIVDAGWLLDSPAHFFLFYCPLHDDLEAAVRLRVFLVPKAKLLQALSKRGFDRAALAGRDELLRQGRWSGVYKSADPDISFQFRAEGDRKPIFVRLNTTVIEKIAVADFLVSSQGELKGKWLGQEVAI